MTLADLEGQILPPSKFELDTARGCERVCRPSAQHGSHTSVMTVVEYDPPSRWQEQSFELAFRAQTAFG